MYILQKNYTKNHKKKSKKFIFIFFDLSSDEWYKKVDDSQQYAEDCSKEDVGKNHDDEPPYGAPEGETTKLVVIGHEDGKCQQ